MRDTTKICDLSFFNSGSIQFSGQRNTLRFASQTRYLRIHFHQCQALSPSSPSALITTPRLTRFPRPGEPLRVAPPPPVFAHPLPPVPGAIAVIPIGFNHSPPLQA